MKVLLVNGSPNKNGCTYVALLEIQKILKEEQIESEIFWLGNKPISGCIDCGRCYKTNECFMGDKVNEFQKLATKADGFIFGTPVHYSGPSGSITSFMDRLFYSSKNIFYLKPAASIVSARRSGTTTTFEQLNQYFTISQMPIISSCYWNAVHGSKAEDVYQDEEGLYTMRVLARNMAFFLKCKEFAIKNGVELPQKEQRKTTNFIR